MKQYVVPALVALVLAAPGASAVCQKHKQHHAANDAPPNKEMAARMAALDEQIMEMQDLMAQMSKTRDLNERWQLMREQQRINREMMRAAMPPRPTMPPQYRGPAPNNGMAPGGYGPPRAAQSSASVAAVATSKDPRVDFMARQMQMMQQQMQRQQAALDEIQRYREQVEEMVRQRSNSAAVEPPPAAMPQPPAL